MCLDVVVPYVMADGNKFFLIFEWRIWLYIFSIIREPCKKNKQRGK